MKYTIKIKDGYIEFEFGKIKLEDIAVDIFEGSMRADYLIEQLKDYNNRPNNFKTEREKVSLVTN